MLKAALKTIFSRVLLKKAFLVYNRFKILTVDKVLFPEYKIPFHDFLVYRKGYPFRENEVTIDDVQDVYVREKMQSWYEWSQEEFILKFQQPCYIEPDTGWAIVPPNRLLYYSLGISRTFFLKKPSWLKFWFRKNVIDLSHAISLRDTGEENYFHFYNDVLTKFFFLKSHSIDISQSSIIISEKLWNKPYFQYYLENSNEMKSLQWVIQRNEYIYCKSVFFCKALTHRKDLFDQIFRPLVKASTMAQRIFVSRNKTRLRHIINAEEVEKLFIKNGFKIVDADQLTLKEQVKLFEDSSAIAGIHGAGLTNIMFRMIHCKVLEIFPYPEESYLPFHYIMLAKMKGFEYNGLVGDQNKSQFTDGFYVNIANLEESIRWLQ